MVLWIGAILCTLALEVAFSSRLRLNVTAAVSRGTQALFLARAGVERAVYDLTRDQDKVLTMNDLRENETRTYHNVELGDGRYTLLATLDGDGEPIYGICDEAGKINLNVADVSVIRKVPGISPDAAAEIVALKKRSGQEFHDLFDLLLIEGIDLAMLFGEDVNGNGLLDPNEDDGDESWPPDNADGRLDCGPARYLTTWSAIRNVSEKGEARVDLNSADAKTLRKSVPGLTAQQAESIVEHRKNKKFAGIADLLDVELVEKTTTSSSGKDSSKKPSDSKKTSRPSAKEAEKPGEKKKSETTYKKTGKKAFDTKGLAGIADYVATTKDKIRKGLVNINTAREEVLECLPGISHGTARAIVKFRTSGADGFTSVADLLQVSGVSTTVFKQVCPHICARSDVHSVLSFGEVGDGGMYRCARAVIDRTGKSPALLYWQEIE